MATIPGLTYTDNMDAAKKPLLVDLRTALDSIQTYINEKGSANLQALALDSFPSGYAFNNDGVKNFSTYSLFDKQTSTPTVYTGGDITISTTSAWTDVDASNAKITFTPDLLAGDFRVEAQFSVSVLTSNATNEALVRFRLVDGVGTASSRLAEVRWVSGVTATRLVVPIHLSHQFDSLAAVSQTIKLQYFIATTTATTIIVQANSNSPLTMAIEKI